MKFYCFFHPVPSRPVSTRLDGKYMTLWAKLEIYLFTHGFGAGSARNGSLCGYLKVMKIYNMAEPAHTF